MHVPPASIFTCQKHAHIASSAMQASSGGGLHGSLSAAAELQIAREKSRLAQRKYRKGQREKLQAAEAMVAQLTAQLEASRLEQVCPPPPRRMRAPNTQWTHTCILLHTLPALPREVVPNLL